MVGSMDYNTDLKTVITLSGFCYETEVKVGCVDYNKDLVTGFTFSGYRFETKWSEGEVSGL